MFSKYSCAAVIMAVLSVSPVALAQEAAPAETQPMTTESAVLPEAKLQAYPSRLVLKPGQTSAEISVINGGTATGQYRLTLQDMRMPQEGVLENVPEGQEDAFSLKPFVRATPRSVTVPAGQSQKFRLLMRIPSDTPAGEYRTHAHIVMTADNVGGAEPPADGTGVAVGFKPRFRFSIPISYVVGDVSFQSTIESMQLLPVTERTPAGKRMLDAWFTHSGNGSSRGDLKVVFTKGGQSYELLNVSGFVIYPGTERRRQEMTLAIPEGVTLDGGVLKLTYVASKENGGGVIAEKDLAL